MKNETSKHSLKALLQEISFHVKMSTSVGRRTLHRKQQQGLNTETGQRRSSIEKVANHIHLTKRDSNDHKGLEEGIAGDTVPGLLDERVSLVVT